MPDSISRHPSARSRFAMVPQSVIADRRVTPALLRMYSALAAYTDATGTCYPTMTTLARLLGCTTSAVAQVIKKLEALGYVQVMRARSPKGDRLGNRYRLLTPDVKAPVAPTVLRPAKKGVLSSTTKGVLSQASPGVLSSASVGGVLSSATKEQKDVPEVIYNDSSSVKPRTPRRIFEQTNIEQTSVIAAPAAQRKNTARTKSAKAPNRSAQVIDALAELGLTIRTDYDLGPRDHAAIKATSTDPALLAEAFAAALRGEWENFRLRDAVAMYIVVDQINAYRTWRERYAKPEHSAAPGVPGRPLSAQPGGAPAAAIFQRTHNGFDSWIPEDY